MSNQNSVSPQPKSYWKILVALVLFTVLILLFIILSNSSSDSKVPQPVLTSEPVAVVSPVSSQPSDNHVKSLVRENKNKPALIEKYTPDTKLTGPLSQHIERLMAEYKAGNLVSGYVLAMNLYDCFGIPETTDELTEQLNIWQNREDIEVSGKKINPGESRARTIEKQFHHCFGISKAMREQSHDLLTEVAEQGYPPAQVMFVISAPPRLMGELFEKKSKEQQQQEIKIFRQEVSQHLHAATESGSLYAMLRLGSDYQYGSDIEKNKVKALT
ncbi:MAG: hypothetical protein ACI8WB_001377, partial [Phenylobacterium sp.]